MKSCGVGVDGGQTIDDITLLMAHTSKTPLDQLSDDGWCLVYKRSRPSGVSMQMQLIG